MKACVHFAHTGHDRICRTCHETSPKYEGFMKIALGRRRWKKWKKERDARIANKLAK